MNFLELIHNEKTYTNPRQIVKILKDEKLNWLIDSEVLDAKIEIRNKTVIWNEGSYLSGDWYFGVFKDGSFFGTWEDGIFEGGHFDGKWISGINLKN